MKTYTVSDGQSLADVAVELYGDVAGVCWLLLDNPVLTAVSDRLKPGLILQIRDDVLNKRMAQYLKDFAPFQTIDENDKPQGIAYWWLDEYEVY